MNVCASQATPRSALVNYIHRLYVINTVFRCNKRNIPFLKLDYLKHMYQVN